MMIPTNIIKIKDKIKKSITLSKRESKLFNVYVDRITGKNTCEEEPEKLDNETLELIKELRKTETKQYMIDIFDYEIGR